MNTTIASGNQVQQWGLQFFLEYVRDSRYARYMSEEGDNVIAMKKELTGKAGAVINFGIIMELDSGAIEGDDTLEGNETNLDNFADAITVNQFRKAVAGGRMEQKKTLLDILNGGRAQLKKWAMAHLRDDITARLLCFAADGVTTYAASTEAQKDTVLGNNTDRVLFGSLLSNRSGSDHSASLLQVDTTSDTLSPDMIRTLSRIAKAADPTMAPLTVTEDEEWWVAFVGTNSMRDFEGEMDALHLHSAPRSLETNPIYRAGDLVYHGVIVREIVEMGSIGTVGTAGAPVYNIAFCGQQGLCLAWGEMTRPIRNGPEGRDYGNVKGVGIAEIRAVKKIFFNDKIHGVVQGYAAAAADA